ncbi:MAG: NAD(P)/FAD-dependent oxidoreductase [Sedimentisphaerales bacterium]|nr:NAD(P)/FAD-dependent oxidoreductase [Sedimentisphaerales bacterium]
MGKKVDILVIGAGPAGIISAVTARKYYPKKQITVMKSIDKGVIPCGVPYMFASLTNPDDNKLGNAALEKNNVEVVVDEATKIDRRAKTVSTKGNQTFCYEKLVLATGSIPIIPRIKGVDKAGVYPIHKNMVYLKKVISEIGTAKNVLIVGGGFIGVELADEISKMNGPNVLLVEILPTLLPNSFDPEFSKIAEEALKSNGVNVLTGVGVEEILGEEKVDRVRLSDGREIAVDGIMLGVGGVPSTKLATEAGLDLGRGRGIWVDEYMRTIDSDIFAVGDCADKRDFYTHRSVPVMLASTATAEARIAGANLYRLKVVRENKGTIAIYSTYVDGRVLGSAGLTEKNARTEGFEIIAGNADCADKHPSALPGSSNIKLKLIFSKNCGIILGGQVAGGISCGELINLIGVAIQKRMSFVELETLQMATHPYLTSAPTVYPVVLAAQNAAAQMRSNADVEG